MAATIRASTFRVFDSPTDILLWDTGHQAYVHKIVTGRASEFSQLRQPDGLSGYPNRAESEHDWIENSHASTVLSYAHGWAEALRAKDESERRHVVAGEIISPAGKKTLTIMPKMMQETMPEIMAIIAPKMSAIMESATKEVASQIKKSTDGNDTPAK